MKQFINKELKLAAIIVVSVILVAIMLTFGSKSSKEIQAHINQIDLQTNVLRSNNPEIIRAQADAPAIPRMPLPASTEF